MRESGSSPFQSWREALRYFAFVPWQFAYLTMLILITLIVYSNTLDNTYYLDSVYRVGNNTEIDTFWPPARFFTDIRTGSTIPQIAEYRPMMPLSHAMDSEIARAIGIDRLTQFHIGNIAIHIGSVILVYFFVLTLITHWRGTTDARTRHALPQHMAFVSALIFAIHPIAGSPVNYIAGRDLLLMVFFFFAAMLVYVRMRLAGDTLSGWVVWLLLICLAILSKQVAIMAFGLVFLFEWILAGQKLLGWGLWRRTLIAAVPTVGYFVFRSWWIIPQRSGSSRAVEGVGDVLPIIEGVTQGLRMPGDLTYPLTMLKAHLFYYLRNFVWPFEMRALAKIEMVDSILDPLALLGLLFILSTLIAAWLLRNKQPLLSFSILAYWLLFSLTSSIFPFRFVITDYRQYPSLVFLALTVTLLLFSLNRKKFSWGITTGLALYFSVSSHVMNRHWKTEETFWGQSVKYGAVALAHNNYGLAVVRKDPALAEYHYKEALKSSPYHIYANINLGLLYLRRGEKDAGIKILRDVVRWNPDWAKSHHWLSVGLDLMGQKQESLQEAQRAVDLDPRSLQYQYRAARLLQDAGRRAEAIPYFEQIMVVNPAYELTAFWLAFALQKNGQPEAAIAMYKQSLTHKPDHVQSNFNLGYELMRTRDCGAAVIHFNRVLELKPTYRETHLHLSRCYGKLGDEKMAEWHRAKYRKAKQAELPFPEFIRSLDLR